MGDVVSEDARETFVRAAFDGVADELIALGSTKSGAVTVHFQNGVPLKIEWRTLAEPISRVLTRTPDP